MITFINVKNLKKYISWSIWGVYICFVIFYYIVYEYTIFWSPRRPRLSRTTTSLTRDRQQTVLIKCCLFICQIFLYCLLMVIQQVYKSNRWRERKCISSYHRCQLFGVTIRGNEGLIWWFYCYFYLFLYSRSRFVFVQHIETGPKQFIFFTLHGLIWFYCYIYSR